jgi:hypothetical protein
MRLAIQIFAAATAGMTILLVGSFVMMTITKAPAPSALHALNAMLITFFVGLCVGYRLARGLPSNQKD